MAAVNPGNPEPKQITFNQTQDLFLNFTPENTETTRKDNPTYSQQNGSILRMDPYHGKYISPVNQTAGLTLMLVNVSNKKPDIETMIAGLKEILFKFCKGFDKVPKSGNLAKWAPIGRRYTADMFTKIDITMRNDIGRETLPETIAKIITDQNFINTPEDNKPTELLEMLNRHIIIEDYESLKKFFLPENRPLWGPQ